MIIDCHTHIFGPGHISNEFIAEANARARGVPIDLHVPPARHWEAMKKVSSGNQESGSIRRKPICWGGPPWPPAFLLR